LTPFLAILAAGIAAQAASAGFEWLYPLPVLGAGAALWRFHSVLGKLPWRSGGEAVVVGVVVFVLWISCHRMSGGARTLMPSARAQAPATLRLCWMAFRTPGGVVTVPLAEENAFRGYLLRRFMATAFAAIDLGRTTAVAILGSSVVSVCSTAAFGRRGSRLGLLTRWPRGAAARLAMPRRRTPS